MPQDYRKLHLIFRDNRSVSGSYSRQLGTLLCYWAARRVVELFSRKEEQMQIDSPGQVATLVPEKRAPIPSPGASSQGPTAERSASTQTERAVREPPAVAESPPRQSGKEGGLDILV